MSANDDGGSAFPYAFPELMTQGSSGMSLREYFAAAALSGLLADAKSNYDANIEFTATLCYKYADAMLEARKR